MKSAPLIILAIVIGLAFAGAVTHARISNPTATDDTTVTIDAFVAESNATASSIAGDFSIATDTPALAQFAIESEQGDGNDYILFVGDQGTSSPMFFIDKKGQTFINDLELGVADLMDVHATGTQTVISGTFEPIVFGLADVVTGDMSFTVTYDGSGNVTSASTTIPHTDNYDISIHATLDKSGGGNQTVNLMLFVNNVEHNECYTESTITSNSETVSISARCIELFTEGDILVWKAQSSGGETLFASVGAAVVGDPVIVTIKFVMRTLGSASASTCGEERVP